MEITSVVALIFASLIGFALGLLGSGGTRITLPVLVYVAGVPMSQAVAMALVVVGGTSLAGSAMEYRRRNLDLRVALWFSVSGMAAAFVGARLTHLVSQPVLLSLFSVIMLGVGVSLLRERREKPVRATGRGFWRCAAAGAAVGALTGFLGIGGGFLIVPALVWFAGLDLRKATGTSLAVIALNSLSGLAGQSRYVHFDWWMALGFLGVATVGMVVGGAVKDRVSEPVLRKTFTIFIFAVGLAMAWENLKKLLTSG